MYTSIKKYIPWFLQGSLLVSYLIVAKSVFNYELEVLFAPICLIYSYIIEILFSKFYFKSKPRFTLTPLIVALASMLLLKTDHLLVYLFSITAAHISKVFILNNNRHFLNPAAFGVVLSLTLFSSYVTSNLNLFNGDMKFSYFFFACGLVTTIVAGMWRVSLSWILCFLIVNLFESFLITSVYWKLYLLIMLNPSFIIFTFHMITDPITSPKQGMAKIFGFTLLLASVESLFRLSHTPNSPFFSLISIQLLIFCYQKFKEGSLLKSGVSFTSSVMLLLSAFYVFKTPLEIYEEKDFKLIKKVQFEESSESLGAILDLDNHKYFDSEKRVRHLHLSFFGGISVGDINNDGFQDFIVLAMDGSNNHGVFINNKGEGFQNKVEEWGLKVDFKEYYKNFYKISIAPTLFDMDGDNDLDLYISTTSCDLIFKNTGNKFELSQENLACGNSQFSYPIDFDEDGDLDLLVLSYTSSNIRKDGSPLFFPNNNKSATNGGMNLILENNSGSFSENESTIYSKDRSFSFDIARFIKDGKQILSIANDFGSNKYYSNNELIDFTKKDSRSSMSISTHYPTNTEYPETYMSNIYLKHYQQEGNFLYLDDEDIATSKGLLQCGWAWGSVFGDLNLDGHNDLYITNGLVTLDSTRTNTYVAMIKNSFTKAQKEFLNVREYDLPFILFIEAGHQKDCNFIYDNETKNYKNFSTSSGIDETWDGRAVASIDYDNDGDLDLIVTSQNDKLRFLKNNLEKNTNWIGFNLEDKKKYIGALFVLKQGWNTYRRLYDYGKSGLMAQSDRRVHFGLLENTPVKLEIHYKDGEIKTFNSINIGQYNKI